MKWNNFDICQISRIFLTSVRFTFDRCQFFDFIVFEICHITFMVLDQNLLLRVFNVIDTDRSRSLEMKECSKFFNYFNFPGPGLLSMFLWLLLKKQKGDKVVFDEFYNFFKHLDKVSDMPGYIYNMSFDHFDEDRSGVIEFTEIFNIVGKYGIAFDMKKESEYYMKRFDKDRNGKLDRNEYMKFIKIFGEDIDI